jgi:hypothetical protein
MEHAAETVDEYPDTLESVTLGVLLKRQPTQPGVAATYVDAGGLVYAAHYPKRPAFAWYVSVRITRMSGVSASYAMSGPTLTDACEALIAELRDDERAVLRLAGGAA